MAGTLVADIGGTNCRLALVDTSGALTSFKHYRNDDYADFDAISRDYLAEHPRPDSAALAVAGPVVNNTVSMTNLGWQLNATELAREHDLQRVDIINDFAALAWATTRLQPDDLFALGEGVAHADANRGILGPGTGLGVSALMRGEHDWFAVAGEGGHVSLPACTAAESKLINAVIAEYGHCSAERLLSGPGLATIYSHLGGERVAPSEVARRAGDSDALALDAIELFGAMLGTVASNLALTLGARGGIYLAGGILPDMLTLFAHTSFRERFEAKGRFGDYLASIPTFIMTKPDPGLIGLAAYVTRS
jgi:glucokinase